MLEPPFSVIDADESSSVTAGVPSSSVIVPVPVPAPSTVETVALVGVPRVTMIVSFGSSRTSPLTLMTIVPLRIARRNRKGGRTRRRLVVAGARRRARQGVRHRDRPGARR